MEGVRFDRVPAFLRNGRFHLINLEDKIRFAQFLVQVVKLARDQPDVRVFGDDFKDHVKIGIPHSVAQCGQLCFKK